MTVYILHALYIYARERAEADGVFCAELVGCPWLCRPLLDE